MTKTLSTKRFVGLALCGLFAVTMLGGCWVTSSKLEESLTALVAKEGLKATRVQVATNKSGIAAAVKKVDTLQAEVETLKELKAKLEDIAKKLAVLDGIPDRMTGAESSLSQHENKLDKLRKDTDDAKLARAELMTAVSKRALKTDMDELSKNVDTNVARLDNKDKDLTGKDTELATNISKLEKTAEALVTDVRTIKVFAAKLDAEMKDLTEKTTTSMAAHNEKITKFSGGVSISLAKEIEMLQKRIITLKEVLAVFQKFKKPDDDAGGTGEPRQ